jgi:signal transduction histidine kinase
MRPGLYKWKKQKNTPFEKQSSRCIIPKTKSNFSPNKIMAQVSKPKKTFEEQTISRSFKLLTAAFTAIVLMSILSYYINIWIGEYQASSQNLSERIRSRTINSNLLFVEITTGASDKDLNEVWILIEGIQGDLTAIGNADIESQVNDKLMAFKGCMLELHGVMSDAAKKKDETQRQSDYYKAYSELNEVTSKIDPHLKKIAEDKISMMKVVYIFMSLFVIVLLGFAGWEVKKFVSLISIMEESNRENNRILAVALNSINSILIFADADQKIILWNGYAEKYFGVPVSKATGGILSEVLPILSRYNTDYHKVLQLQATEEINSAKFAVGEMERIVNIRMIPTPGSSGVVIIIDDVTDAETSRKQVDKAQKLETVRNMMKSLVSDFNGIFAQLSRTIGVLEGSVEDQDSEETTEIRKSFESIRNTYEKVHDKVRKLAYITKEKEFIPSKIELNTVINKALDVCQDLFDKDIQVNRTLYDVKAYTVADAELLEIVLFNMFENAADALTIMKPEGQPKGGIIEISLEKIFPDRNYRQIHPLAMASSYWVINVADNGVGMEAEICAQIFDPFFTTKGDFGAAGVGLTVADEIARKHRGFIEVYSVPEQGTSFSVFIPETV